MQITKTRVSEPRTYSYVEKVICDLCGHENPVDNDWAEESNYKDKITIEREVGLSCSDGGDLKITAFDLCPDCFTEKLVPWLITQGAKIQTRQREW